jgi:predicted dehydrogenase
MSKPRLSRREFIRATTGIAGATLAARSFPLEPSMAWALPPRAGAVPPSDRVRFGIVGVGMQGSGLLANAIELPGVECVAACDLYDGRRELATEIVGKPIPTTRRYHELLDNKEIDCLIAAVPDHWHKQVVVDASSAGKDVYCEKPMTHRVDEGFEMIAAAEKNNRIVQIGSQAASSIVSRKAKELLGQGVIGDVYLVESFMGRNDPTGAWEYPPPPDLSPQNLDWETWLGTAPKIPFNPLHFARWRCWQAYGSGVAGDLFVHMLTAIHFILGVEAPPLTAASKGGLYRWKDGRDVPDVHNTLFEYPRFNVDMCVTLTTELPGLERFLGTRGALELREGGLFVTQQDGEDHSPSYYADSFPKRLREPYQKQWHEKNDARPGTQSAVETTSYHTPPEYDVTREHLWNFFQAVRTRQPVVEDTVFGNHAAIACHMANYSYFKKTLAVWDATSKSIKTA